jgi:hypothetical protein
MPQNNCLICGSEDNLQKTPESTNTKPEYMCIICKKMNDEFNVLESKESPSISDHLSKKDT